MSLDDQLQVAVFNRKKEEVKKILDQNPGINTSQKLIYYSRLCFPFASWNQWSLLAYAVFHRYADIAELLLQKNANLNEKIPNGLYQGWSLFAYAVYQRDLALAEMLIRSNANISLEVPYSAIHGYGLINLGYYLVQGKSYSIQDKQSVAYLIKKILNYSVERMHKEQSEGKFQLSTYQNYFKDNSFFIHPVGSKFYNEAIFDVAMIMGTLWDTHRETANTRLLLKKIYYLIHNAGLYTRGINNTWHPWKQTGLSLASALCRGSKVLIQLPRNCNRELRKQFEQWLSLTYSARRLIASHDIETITQEYIPNIQKFKWLKEIKTGITHFQHLGQAAAGTATDALWQLVGASNADDRAANIPHFGFNLALGGMGNTNPLNSNTYYGVKIKPNGEHGHLYICRPTNIKHTHPGILVAIEPSAPGYSGQNGHDHDMQATSSPVGVNGGCRFGMTDEKQGMFDMYSRGPTIYHDGLFVDLSNGEQLRRLMADFREDLDLSFISKFPDEENYLLL